MNIPCTVHTERLRKTKYPKRPTRTRVCFALLIFDPHPLVVCGQEYDLWTTKILTPDLREAFAALWVKGDGNCLWRAVSRGLWGIDEYWLQLKLVVLGWGFENVEALLGERVPECFKNAGCYENDIYRKHDSSLAAAQSEDQRVAAFAPLLREHIASRCANKAWGGPICAILVAERFGLVVKVIDPGDFLSRRERDAQSHSGGCTDDDHFEDNRLSRQYTPSQKRNIVKVRGFDGEKDSLVHEVVVALCFSCVPITGDSSLPDTPVMAGGDKLPILDHFASIVSWDRIDRPTFPFFKAAPPLFPRHVSDVYRAFPNPLLHVLVVCVCVGENSGGSVCG